MKIKLRSALIKKANRGFRGYPLATLAFYGPDNTRATKVAVGIKESEDSEMEMTKLFSDTDVRFDPRLESQIKKLLVARGVKTLVAEESLLGCPHEEGVDYPDGEVCPQCPYWANRDRFTGDLVDKGTGEREQDGRLMGEYRRAFELALDARARAEAELQGEKIEDASSGPPTKSS